MQHILKLVQQLWTYATSRASDSESDFRPSLPMRLQTAPIRWMFIRSSWLSTDAKTWSAHVKLWSSAPYLNFACQLANNTYNKLKSLALEFLSNILILSKKSANWNQILRIFFLRAMRCFEYNPKKISRFRDYLYCTGRYVLPRKLTSEICSCMRKSYAVPANT